MKAIVTKFRGATDRRGSRITARADGVASVTIPYPHELREGEDCHAQAAIALYVRHDWDGRLIGGSLPRSQGYVFVFMPKTAGSTYRVRVGK